MNTKIRWLLAGLCFSILWASASAATKVALQSAQPLVIAVIRFAIAAGILLVVSHVVLRNRLPSKRQWKQLTVYGLLNITIYLGLYVISMQYLTAGISALAVATNPVLIGFLSFVFLKTKWTGTLSLSIFVCCIGVLCAAWPLLHTAMVTSRGLVIILLSMLSYSAGALYFSSKQWDGLDLLTINGWQTLIGGLLLLPFALALYESPLNHFNIHFGYTVVWLAVPVSIGAVQLWMWLLKTNPIKASLWLFLCPLFGFLLSAWLLGERITSYTVAGIVLVIAGLAVAQKNGRKQVMTAERQPR